MPTLFDLIYVVLFAVAGPLVDYLRVWPAMRRRFQTSPARARMQVYAWSQSAWVVVAIGGALWLYNDRSWTSFGFTVPDGWRLWAAVALILLLLAYAVYAVAAVARDPQARASVRQQSGKFADIL